MLFVFCVVSSLFLLLCIELQSQLLKEEKADEEQLLSTEEIEHPKYLVPPDLSTKYCSPGFISSMGSCLPCPKGHFSLTGWITCLPYLSCIDIKRDVRIEGYATSGGVKHVFYAEWSGASVMFNQGYLEEDVQHGIEMLKSLTPHVRVVHPIGICGNSLVTLRYRLGSAERMNEVLARQEYKRFDNCATRFRMALDYVTIIAYLHNSPVGVRVMCDSADLEKTLSQYLITDDLRLVVNDVDALPEVKHDEGKLIKCGRRELYGDFLAPEQKWPFPGEPFSDDRMPPYDEKVDIWRIPPVVEFIMGQTDHTCNALSHLQDIHLHCRNIDPRRRPSAKEVSEQYEMVWMRLSSAIMPY